MTLPPASKLRDRLLTLKREVRVLAVALRDPRTPRRAKLLGACVVAYAVSPLDLIPDPIPVLGYLDDLILVPLGVWLVLKMIPAEVMEDSRARAVDLPPGRARWVVAALIVLAWVLTAWLIGRLAFSMLT